MFAKLRRLIRYYYLRFMRLQGDPHSLALGAAIGILIGISPTFPLHTVMIIALTVLLRASPLSALIAAALISNPLTVVPQYYLCWKVGDLLLPGRLSWDKMQGTLELIMSEGFREGLATVSQLGLDAVIVMLAGGALLGLPAALVAYVFSFRFFVAIRQKRRKKHLLN